MIECLRQGEKVVADNGYHHINCTTPNTVDDAKKAMHSRFRARHETCNARKKVFNALNCTFRHCIYRHNVVFHAAAKLVALSIQNEDPLFSM